MKSAGKFIFALGFAVCLAATARAGTQALPSNPYTTISERNVFALVPIPTNPPVTDSIPKDPPPKITPNGIISLFGKLEVLFKVAVKPAPGQPAKDESHVMGEGERENDIEVIKIDQAAERITFRNHGELQELALAEAPKITTPAATGSSGIPVPGGASSGGLNPAAAARFGRPPGSAATRSAAPSSATPAEPAAGTTGGGNSRIYNPATDDKPVASAAVANIAPEDAVLVNYMDAKAKNDPVADLFPISAKDKKDANAFLADPNATDK
jgi:hypothetical protein